MWRVVCLAAVCALDHVRRATSARTLAGLTETGASMAACMADRAVARFWDLLTDFCVLGLAPPSLAARPGQRPPFHCLATFLDGCAFIALTATCLTKTWVSV